jgi:hypothetical protein
MTINGQLHVGLKLLKIFIDFTTNIIFHINFRDKQINMFGGPHSRVFKTPGPDDPYLILKMFSSLGMCLFSDLHGKFN